MLAPNAIVGKQVAAIPIVCRRFYATSSGTQSTPIAESYR